MSRQYKITLTELADSDVNISKMADTTVPVITPPDNLGGWKLEYSLRGEYKMYHFWTKGGIEYGSGFETYWTGIDDTVSGIGDGKLLSMTTVVGEPEARMAIDINHAYPVYIYGGQAIWQNAGNLTDNNALSMEVVAKATTLQTAANLDLALDGDKVYYAGAGTGTHGFAATPTLVVNPDNTGYWDYDGTTILPAASTGKYDIYTIDKLASQFINNIIIFGDNPVYKEIQTPNTWLIPPAGYELNLVLHNRSNTVWSAAFLINLLRKTTVTV